MTIYLRGKVPSGLYVPLDYEVLFKRIYTYRWIWHEHHYISIN